MGKSRNSGNQNPMFGKHLSEEAKRKLSLIHIGQQNPMWKGDNVGYFSLHEWVINRLKRPEVCSSCHQKKTVELSNISGKYKRDLSDWEWLCRKCHMVQDGRYEKFLKLPRPSQLVEKDKFGRFSCKNA